MNFRKTEAAGSRESKNFFCPALSLIFIARKFYKINTVYKAGQKKILDSRDIEF